MQKIQKSVILWFIPHDVPHTQTWFTKRTRHIKYWTVCVRFTFIVFAVEKYLPFLYLMTFMHQVQQCLLKGENNLSTYNLSPCYLCKLFIEFTQNLLYLLCHYVGLK